MFEFSIGDKVKVKDSYKKELIELCTNGKDVSFINAEDLELEYTVDFIDGNVLCVSNCEKYKFLNLSCDRFEKAKVYLVTCIKCGKQVDSKDVIWFNNGHPVCSDHYNKIIFNPEDINYSSSYIKRVSK